MRPVVILRVALIFSFAAMTAQDPSNAVAQEPPGAVAQDPCAPRGAPIPPPPESAPDDPPLPVPYDPLRGMGTVVDLGMGHLRVADDSDADWYRRVEFPVYTELGAEPSGWIVEGWWMPADDTQRAVPLTTEAMVETGYEVASWIVVAARSDGWVRFRFAPDPDGFGWASRCHLSASDPAIVYESWDARFGGETMISGPLFFRARDRHALRRGPGPTYPRTFWLVGGDATELAPLEIRGDWMRLRATSPPLYCADPPPNRALVEEGWIRWRDDAIGPWVWWYTRGC